MTFEITSGPLDCHVPDDLTIPQFILDAQHPLRPVRQNGIPWLIDDVTGRHINGGELRTRTFGFANALSSRFGIKDGDVVVLFSPNHVDYPIAIWGTHRLGGVVSGANPAYTAGELLHQLQLSNATLVVCNSGSLTTAVSAARQAGIPDAHVVVFDEVPGGVHMSVEALVQEGLKIKQCFVEPKLKPGEAKTKLAFLNFSSGTTGKPKAVAISHYAPIVNVLQMAIQNGNNQNVYSWEDQRFRPGDVAAGILPFYHIYGLVLSLHYLMFCGVSLVVVPRFSFLEFLRSISRHRITTLMLVPPQIVLLCKHPAVKDFDLSRIRYMISGAAPLSAELTAQLMKVIPNAHIGQGYGMTESAGTVTMFSPNSKIGVSGSAGKLLPGVIARVVKAGGTHAGFNELGELQVKSPSLALGYWNNEQATKDTFVDGWLRTGDEVTIREDLELFIVDRLKEIMKVKGFQVAPAELEGCLLGLSEVADACVVPVEDEFSGEVPLAFVVLHAHVAKRVASNPAEAAKVKAAIIKHVADTKVPYKHLAGGVQFIDVIPKNPSGKLLRRVLRDQAKTLRTKTKARL